MNISKFFIERPVATVVLTVAVILFGLFAYRALPISELPEIDFPTIMLSANLPGADPETMANTVATPLEKALSSIPGLDSMSSVNTTGQTNITMQFALNRDIDAASQDVQTVMMQVLRTLPDALTPPVIRKINPAAAPILFLSLTGDNIPLTSLNDYAETYIAQRLSMITGVAQVAVYGGQTYAVRIHLNPHAIASRKLSNAGVINAIQAANPSQPAGTLMTPERTYNVKAISEFTDADAFNKIIIGFSEGAPVRLQDVAKVENSVENDLMMAWYNNQRAISLAIMRQVGSNTVEVVDEIKKLLPTLTHELPGGAKLNITYDRSVFIRQSLSEMKLTLALAVVLVAGVILLFLGNISSTFIAIISLPIALVATFMVMLLLRYNLDTLSLIGLVLAVGFIVDDAIVVLENIVRYLEQGYDRFQAAMKGSTEIVFTIISMTISLVAVFIPLLFMGGIIGRLFREFSIVVSASILLSGVISLTLTPMLCAQLLRPNKVEHSFFPRFERFYLRSKNLYEQALRWSLHHSKLVLSLTGVVLLLTVLLFVIVPKGFIASQDSGIIYAMTKVPVGLPVAEFADRQQALATMIRHNPNVAGVTSAIGQGRGGGKTSSSGQMFIRLKSADRRKLNADQLIAQLRQDAASIPGIQVFFINPPPLQIGSKTSTSSYQYILQGNDFDQLQQVSEQLLNKLKSIPGVKDVDTDLDLTSPEIRVKILHDRAAALGISNQAIEMALYNAYGQRQVSTIYTPLNEYPVIIDVGAGYQQNTSALRSIYVPAADNTLVPLSSLASFEQGVGPLSINHYGQLPSVVISYNLALDASLGKVNKQVENIAKNILPIGVSGSFGGSAQVFQASTNTLPMLLVITIFVIYVVLAILYEHFIHPLTILTALPFAAFGALLMLMLFHMELDLFSFIGIILLVGLVKKNGIMMVDFAIEARRKLEMNAKEAIINACLIRYRPIMMTTMTAILATLPLAIGFGAGSEARRPMGVAVVGGLLFSQMLTLFVTPVFYLVMEKFTKKFRKISLGQV